MRIAPEGYTEVAAGASASIIAWTAYILFPVITFVPGIAFTVLTLAMLYFFRDPLRASPIGDDLLLSPADGTMLPTHRQIPPDGSGLRMVSIFLSVFNVHVNRCPVSGRVEKIERIPGRFKFAFLKEAASSNAMNRIMVRSPFGAVIIQQVAGAVARRTICSLKEGESVEAGSRMGIIKFGSRMDLILPANIEIKVKPGDKVRAGRTIIGVWTDNEEI